MELQDQQTAALAAGSTGGHLVGIRGGWDDLDVGILLSSLFPCPRWFFWDLYGSINLFHKEYPEGLILPVKGSGMQEVLRRNKSQS